MKYKNQTLNKYLNDLAAKTPAPGGGSVCALNAALGAGLISMVVNFTLGKPRYAAFQSQLKTILSKSEKLRKEFLELVDLDVLAYQSKDLRKSLNVPLKVARLSVKAAQLCLPLITKGNINLISDVAVAAVLLESAFSSAYYNVRINLKILGQAKLSRTLNQELNSLYRVISRIRLNTEERVGKVIRG
jgi:formiminotetrahydrofolate cyclodeaminase